MDYRGWSIYPAGDAPVHPNGPVRTYPGKRSSAPLPVEYDSPRGMLPPMSSGKPYKATEDNPRCERCGGRTRRNGHRLDGTQTYRCAAGCKGAQT